MKSRWVQNEASKAIVIQFAFVLMLTPIIALIWTVQVSGSFLLGGLISVLANTYFYFRVFSRFGARAARQIVNAFYRGEAVKIAMTAIGFGVAFKIFWVSPLWLFIGYIAAQTGFLLGNIKRDERSGG